MNFTQEQLDLQAHIKADNDAFVARCKAEGATAWGVTVDDPAHWAEMGVFNIDQYERQSLISYISDAHKDAHGFRPRHFDYESMSMDELKALADRISDEVAESIKLEEEREASAYKAWKTHLRNLMDMGASNIKQALVWDMQAENADEYDLGYYCFLKGISYRKEKMVSRILGLGV
tara:strand:+ start:189 stop:716 length:528 start_codon:yes stop_codon:yes gene_type:complete